MTERPSGTKDTGQPTCHNTDIDAEMRVIREKGANLIRTRQILEQPGQQKKASLANTKERGSNNAGGNLHFPFRNLSDGGAIYTATNLLREDIKLNSKMYPERNLLPNIKDTLGSLVGEVFFSMLDQFKMYHQHHKESRYLARFIALTTFWINEHPSCSSKIF